MANFEVSWSGDIYHKTKLVNHLVWGILLRESATGYNRLELYSQSINCRSSIKVPIHTIYLSSVLNILVEGMNRLKYYDFTIICVNGREQFSLRTAEQRTGLVHKLNCLIYSIPEPGIIYNFQVQVLPSSNAERLNLAGSYVLRVFENGITLYSASGNLPTPFNCSLSDLEDVRVTENGDLLGHVWLLCGGLHPHNKSQHQILYSKEFKSVEDSQSILLSSKSAMSIVHILQSRKKTAPQLQRVKKVHKKMPGSLPFKPVTSSTTDHDLGLSHSYLESVTSWLGQRSPLKKENNLIQDRMPNTRMPNEHQYNSNIESGLSDIGARSKIPQGKLTRRQSSEDYVAVDVPSTSAVAAAQLTHTQKYTSPPHSKPIQSESLDDTDYLIMS